MHFPEGFGGLGVSPKLQNIVNAKLTAAGRAAARTAATRSVTACARRRSSRTAATSRSAATCGRCSPAKRSGARCSASPAPAPTSPGLSTRAVRDGDEWIVNGQKVWTTLAHVARFGIVLVRTDPEQPKHKGMTMFVVDMHAPGVEVRPLVQATGEAEFNEVYFTDVRIPDAERLGDVGEGWGVSLTTLMNERVSIGGQVHPRGSGLIAVAVHHVDEQHARAARRRRARRARPALDRGRGQPAHQHPRVAVPQEGHARARKARSASSRWPASTSG